MNDNKITFEQFCDPEFRKSEQIKVKSEATWKVFNELNGLINISKFARDYFGKTQSWFCQKLYGLTVCNKRRTFTDGEYKQIASALRELSARLNTYADIIDSAAYIQD